MQGQSISRRGFVLLGATLTAFMAQRANEVVALAPDPGRDSDQPYLPNAIFGYAAMASNINADSLFTEPISMIFFVYGFASDADAAEAFPEVVAYLQNRADDLGIATDMEYRRVSIGRIGDEREGYYSEGIDTARDLLAIIRVGPNILYLRSLALAGKTDEFVAEYLESFLADASDDPMSLIPEISDLPVGWELDEPVWADDILEIITTPEGGATPTA